MSRFVGRNITEIKATLGARHVILGSQFGIALLQRGENDPHVCLSILSEDDKNWFMSKEDWSSFWLQDLQYVLLLTQEYLTEHCNIDRDGFGFEFEKYKKRTATNA